MPRTLYAMIDRGEVPAYRFGRVIRLKQQDLEPFVDTLKIEQGELRHLYPHDPDEGDA